MSYYNLNKSSLAVTPFLDWTELAISAGQYSGTSIVHKFGRNTDVDTASQADIWDGGTTALGGQTYPWPTAAGTLSVVGGVNDDAGGTGALTVEIQGLDASYLLLTEVVTMNGAGGVTTSGSFIRVFRAKVLTAGSGGANGANIVITRGADDVAVIIAGENQTLMSLYTIPANKTGYLVRGYASLNKKANVSADISFYIRQINSVFQVKQTIALHSQGTTTITIPFPVPLPLPEKTDLRVSGSVSANNGDISSGFDVILIDN